MAELFRVSQVAQEIYVRLQALESARGLYVLNPQTGTTYTPVSSDIFKFITLSNAGAIAVTIPPTANIAGSVGQSMDFVQLGAGQVTFVPGLGVTLRSTPGLKTRTQYSTVSAIILGVNDYLLVGDLAA